MKHAVLAIAVMLLLGPPVALAGDLPRAVLPERHRELLVKHCQKCHGPEKQEGKLRLDTLPYAIENLETAERWQKVLNALNAGEMPPADEVPLASVAKADLLEDLAGVMVAARKGLSDQRGLITMRRLNRREYRNTLRELLGVEINVSELPSDTGTGGFDTVGSNLFMSGNQFEQYLALGREALDEAFERQAVAGETRTLHYEAEESLAEVQKHYQEDLEALERAERWAKGVDEAAARPENAAIVADLRKESKTDAIFRRSWQKIAGAPAPEEFGFRTGENNADKANRALGYKNGYFRPYHEYYLQQPHLDTGAYLTIQGAPEIPNDSMTVRMPPKWPIGRYIVRVRVAAVDGAEPQRRFLEFGTHPRSGQILSTHHVTGTMESPQIIEMPLTITRKNSNSDDRSIFIREKGTADHFTQTRARFGEGKRRNGIGPEVALWVDWMEVERQPDPARPLPPGIAALDIALDDKSPTPGRDQLRGALQRFSQEAFRGRAPQAGFVDRLLGIYDMRREAGDKHGAALKETLSVVLASPLFLYLAEPCQDTSRRPLSQQELATRLAYFLWGAPPDAELRDLAGRGELARPEVLAAQTDRLLDDPRSDGFIRPLVYQWLGLDRLDFFEINRALYPRCDDATKLAARNEVYESFAFLLRFNGSLQDLLAADYVVIDSVLANYYGIEGVAGDGFRPVAVPAGSPRGGLLGMAAVHVMGGNGERTSPVERGAWVLRKLLNDPPPPAPANVPQIARLAGKLLTTQERLRAHQEEPQCASCHRKIDPIGLGLENFDAVGQWRIEDTYQLMDPAGKPDPQAKKTWTIEAAAQLHNGPAFHDYFELRSIVAGQADAFARGFGSALVEYALGRPVGFSDEPLVEAIRQRAANNKYAVREFVQALVASQEFHTK